MSSLNNPPESCHNVDSGTLRDVDNWISSGHPTECVTRLNALLTSPSFKYLVTAQRLVAHCVEQHSHGMQTIAKMCKSFFPAEPEKVGLSRSIQINQARLVDEILAEWKSLDMQNENSQAVALVASSIDEAHFGRLWKSTWRFYCQARWRVRNQFRHNLQSLTIHFPLFRKVVCLISRFNGLQDLARNGPSLAGALFRVTAYSPSKSSYAIDLIDQSSEDLFQIIPYDLIFSLIWSPQLRQRRDEELECLLSRYGVTAAKAIITHSQWVKEVPPCVSTATKFLLNSKPDDPVTTVGVGLCLQLDPDLAIPIIVDWITTGKSNHYEQFFRWKVEQSDQRDLFRAMAKDAVKRDYVWHHALAQVHQGLMTRSEHVLEWLSETVGDPQASRYNASLVSAYLSETRKKVTPERSKKLIMFGHLLHEKYGLQTEKKVLMESNLTDPKLENYEELVAIALARDVIFPTRNIDGARTLRTIKQLSFTYKALGGVQLDKAIAEGAIPPYAVYYEVDAEYELKKLDARLKSDEIDLDEFKWAVEFPNRALAFTTIWEKRFAKICKAGIKPPSRKLQTDENVWNEMRILAQLVDHFEAVYEPTNVPGMGMSPTDFLLKSKDGDLILEIATIGRKPDDVREAVTTSLGGDVKKTLQSKLREQFNECQGNVTLPIVIAIQTRWSGLDVFDFLNSLYGPLGVKVRMNKESGEIVEEGASRNIEKAFFSQPNVKCISAVMRIEPNESHPDYAIGELYRPIEAPHHPLNMKLWVRLRDAIFGPMPKNIVDQIRRIPGISLEEAETLVRYGVDDLSFFGSGMIELPENLPLNKKRFEQLQEMAGRLIQIHRTGRIAHLSSAQGIDLTPLYDQNIYTINQLVQCEQKPDDISEEVWRNLKEEASKLQS